MFATFYSDFLDSLLMSLCFFISAIGAILAGNDAHHIMIDSGIAASSSHHKYPTRHMQLCYW